MSKCDKLLKKAKNAATSLRYAELCHLAECYGFVLDRQAGSHAIYKRANYQRAMNFQDDGGKAKPYQVRQLIAALQELGLINE